MAFHNHRDLVVSLPSDASELSAVPEHIKEVGTTHVRETPSVNPPSQGFTTLTEINSVSLDLGMANQVGQAASDHLHQPPYRGFILSPPPPF